VGVREWKGGLGDALLRPGTECAHWLPRRLLVSSRPLPSLPPLLPLHRSPLHTNPHPTHPSLVFVGRHRQKIVRNMNIERCSLVALPPPASHPRIPMRYPCPCSGHHGWLEPLTHSALACPPHPVSFCHWWACCRLVWRSVRRNEAFVCPTQVYPHSLGDPGGCGHRLEGQRPGGDRQCHPQRPEAHVRAAAAV
jgi:hypothetical protein